MDLSFTRIRKKSGKKSHLSERERKLLFWENVNILIKVTGMITWIFIFFLALMEIKMYFNIDVFPNYNSSFEEVYGAVRGTITNGGK